MFKNGFSLVENLGDQLQYSFWMPVRGTEEGPKPACTVTGRHKGHHSLYAPDPCGQPQELVQSGNSDGSSDSLSFLSLLPLIVPHDEDLPCQEAVFSDRQRLTPPRASQCLSGKSLMLELGGAPAQAHTALMICTPVPIL